MWWTAVIAASAVVGVRARKGWFAVKLGCWQDVLMKTTFDLPDELVRRIKIEAARSDRKLKDLVAQLLEAGLRASRDDGSAAALPKPVKRLRGGPLTADAIEAAIAAGRE
jgi:plasmid stability protein